MNALTKRLKKIEEVCRPNPITGTIFSTPDESYVVALISGSEIEESFSSVAEARKKYPDTSCFNHFMLRDKETIQGMIFVIHRENKRENQRNEP